MSFYGVLLFFGHYLIYYLMYYLIYYLTYTAVISEQYAGNTSYIETHRVLFDLEIQQGLADV